MFPLIERVPFRKDQRVESSIQKRTRVSQDCLSDPVRSIGTRLVKFSYKAALVFCVQRIVRRRQRTRSSPASPRAILPDPYQGANCDRATRSCRDKDVGSTFVFRAQETFYKARCINFDALVADRAQKLWNVNLVIALFRDQPQRVASRREEWLCLADLTYA